MTVNATHATVAHFEADPSRLDEQLDALRERIVPGVSRARGFVAGYWTRDPSTHESHVMLLFDSREAADAVAENVRANTAGQKSVGMALKRIVVTEVAARAGSA